MKKALKFILISIIILVILVIAAVASVPFWFPINKVKDIVVEQMSIKTGRDIQVKGFQFNILKGMELRDVSISESKRYKTTKPFIKADLILLKYNLLALLKRTLIVYDFRVVSPYGSIIKEADGTFNFSDMLENLTKGPETEKEKLKLEKKKAAKEAKKAAKKDKGKKAAPFDIVITSLSIKDGNFQYYDRSGEKPMKIGIKKLNFKLDDVILSAVKPIGIFLDCTAFYNNYNIPVLLRSTVKADIKTGKADINVNPFTVGGLKSTGKVTVINFKDFTGDIVSVSNTKKMLEILPPDMNEKVKLYDADIDINNKVSFSMKNGKLTFKDKMKWANGSLAYNKKKVVENLNAEFNAASDYSLTGNVDFILAGSAVKIKAKGENINSPSETVAAINISSPKFAIEYLLALFPRKEKKKKVKDMTAEELKDYKLAKEIKAKKTKAAVRSLKGKKLPGVYLNLNADSIFFKEVNTGKAIINVRFVDNKLYSEAAIMAYKGSLNNNLIVDLNKETYSVGLKIKNIESSKLVNDAITIMPKEEKKKDKKTLLDDIKDKVYGTVNLEAQFNGTTFDDVGRTIKGSGKMHMKDGKITKTETGETLAKKFGLDFLAKDIPFDNFNADFNMAKGKINVTKLSILNGPNGEKGDLKIRAKGYITVDKALDFKVETDLSPREAAKVDAYFEKTFGIKDAKNGANPDGWMPFDFRVYNTVEKKKYDFSQARIVENVKRNMSKKLEQEIKSKGEEFLKNLFKK